MSDIIYAGTKKYVIFLYTVIIYNYFIYLKSEAIIFCFDISKEDIKILLLSLKKTQIIKLY